MKRLIVSMWALVSCVWATPSLAIEFNEHRGGWDIFGDDESCYMGMEYEGPGETMVVFIKYADGRIGMSVSNYNWSTDKGEKYDVTYVLNGTAYGGAGAVGTKNSGRSGFVSIFEPDFENQFRRGSTLHIFLKEIRIDQLSLAGTGVALDSLNRCLVRVKAAIAADAKEKARWAHLPRDPFAEIREPQEAKPRGNAAAWASGMDYPSAALRESRTGKVGYTLAIDSEGRVTNCTITSTSGHADLDAATCSLLQRRARFEPAVGKDGKPIAGSWSSTMNWSMPQ